MRIKEVIIDGFKSYATRTVVSGFDAHFNAITGLNGSGKSNILDAICFTLGITNLHQVRVSNLQELVYKQGQAGVTKASVTIVFDNSNEKQSPVGYDQYKELTITRQVVIGGKNKYLINGHTATSSQVQNLFHSVQLNVNNPHFLIMQGRITKVLNMKPIEILGMIEEAAGTRMYETKKQSALRTIEKKEAKVAEINRTMSQEISPTLDTLRSQQADYIKFQANKTDIERQQRFIIAFKYSDCKKKLDKSEATLQSIMDSKQECEAAIDEIVQQMKAKDDIISELSNKKEADMEGAFAETQEEEESLSKELVRMNSVWQNTKSDLKKKQKQLVSLEKQLKDLDISQEKLQESISNESSSASELNAALVEAQDQVQALQRQLQALSAGISDEGDGSQSLTALHLDLKGKLQEAKTIEKQKNMTAKHMKKEVSETAKLLQKCEREGATLEKERTTAQKKLENAQEKLSEIDFDPKLVASLKSEVRDVEEKISFLKEKKVNLEAKLKHVTRFDYRDPKPGFNRNKVKGFVASLIDVKDDKSATALEITAGGKLYQIVVDTEETGKLLLQKGKLKRRVTIIPLNRIQSHPISDSVLNAAQRVGGKDNVKSALSLIGYPEELDQAMKYVFGSTLICSDLDTARKVTFHKDVRKKSVTLDGDSFDPSGTLSGGSRSKGAPILSQLQELSQVTQQLHHETNRLKELRSQLRTAMVAENDYNEFSSQVELENHNLTLTEQRIGESQFSILKEKLKSNEVSLDEATGAVKSSKQSAIDLKSQISDIEDQIADFESHRVSKTKLIEDNINDWKKKVVQATNKTKKAEDRMDSLDVELLSIKNERTVLLGQINDMHTEISNLEGTAESQRVVSSDQKKKYTDVKAKLDEMKEAIVSCDKEMKLARQTKAKLAEKKEQSGLEKKKIEGKLSRHGKEQSEMATTVKSLLKKYEWIESEEAFFGQPHTDYDFKTRNPKQVERRIGDLEKEQSALSKCINKKVIGMLEKAELDYKELVNKRQIIEKDKNQIENVIAELDEKKNEVLQTTWKKVNRDFGSIFSTLLPGTDAKLQPVEGKSALDGLEVKVAFGGKFKESLTELSGGQRSLLALSLVLSLLLFKPAPMYILDEVDAALDLSHTQNIGQIIKKHFSGSQFIVVSLKEGMFNNANVIFRTKFVDGLSTVKRTALNSKKSLEENEDEETENEFAPKTKKSKHRAGGAKGGRRATKI